ncbi:Hypothetical predicted protein [Pelobates cultripes]|uniref:Uncharacterized protein n=1 Tax=Pelobates cultripes TaxID=61616 RepID=A0AAD1VKL9_PELCU|nr:Hypothetical predicted protein [Pelobates cultripes]
MEDNPSSKMIPVSDPNPAESTENEFTAYPQQQDQTQVTAGRLERMLTTLGNGRQAADTYPGGRTSWLGVRPRSPPPAGGGDPGHMEATRAETRVSMLGPGCPPGLAMTAKKGPPIANETEGTYITVLWGTTDREYGPGVNGRRRMSQTTHRPRMSNRWVWRAPGEKCPHGCEPCGVRIRFPLADRWRGAACPPPCLRPAVGETFKDI